MLAHVLVLLCGCACALSVGPDGDGLNLTATPHYTRARDAYKELVEALQENILSLGLNISGLDDPRRHHAVIFNVINYEAVAQSNCGHKDYGEEYIENLNNSVLQAVNDPEKVLSAAENLINGVDEITKNITPLIDICLGTEEGCDVRVDDAVKQNKEKYEAEVLILAGRAASEINKQAALYNYIANNKGALHFVLNAKDVLEKPVMSLANLYRHGLSLNRPESAKC